MELQKLHLRVENAQHPRDRGVFGLPRGHVQRYSEAENERLLEPPNSTLGSRLGWRAPSRVVRNALQAVRSRP